MYDNLMDILNYFRQERDELEIELDEAKRRERELKQQLHEVNIAHLEAHARQLQNNKHNQTRIGA